MSRLQFIDKYLNKYLSRKLFIMLVAIIALFIGQLDGDNFTLLALTYIGSQSIIDAAERLYKAKKPE